MKRIVLFTRNFSKKQRVLPSLSHPSLDPLLFGSYFFPKTSLSLSLFRCSPFPLFFLHFYLIRFTPMYLGEDAQSIHEFLDRFNFLVSFSFIFLVQLISSLIFPLFLTLFVQTKSLDFTLKARGLFEETGIMSSIASLSQSFKNFLSFIQWRMKKRLREWIAPVWVLLALSVFIHHSFQSTLFLLK
jgi:hypothetical protein